jgi:hypothetical protein
VTLHVAKDSSLLQLSHHTAVHGSTDAENILE